MLHIHERIKSAVTLLFDDCRAILLSIELLRFDPDSQSATNMHPEVNA